MNYDELQKLMNEVLNNDAALNKVLLDRILSNKNIPTSVGHTVKSKPSPRGTYAGSLSPTDVDAKGMYEYQEPEQDEQGTFYGYKILHTNPRSAAMPECDCDDCISLVSPRYHVLWRNGELHADRFPDVDHMHGIHFTKRPDHPELGNYVGGFRGAAYSHYYDGGTSLLVRCALSGTVVETEQGFRAEHAQIIGVLIDGDWQSYQDYQERTRAHRRSSVTGEKWETKTDWRLQYGKSRKGTPDTFWQALYNPSADS